MYKLLLVDDEPMIRKGLVKMIQSRIDSIRDIRTAENGEEALILIEQDEPNFLFTDIRMPKLDGLELCRIVSENYPNIQLVVITGYDDFDYARRCISYGVKEYVLKPVTKRSMAEVVQRLIQAERKREQAVISLYRFHEWVERMAEAVWTMQEDALARQVDLIFQELRNAQVPFSRMKLVVRELSSMLNTRLNERDIFPLALHCSVDEADTPNQLKERLFACTGEAVEQLRMKRRGKIRDPIEEAKMYIENNLSRDFSLEEVAERVGLNASYFSQLFKQMTGETFAQYRIRRRIERAKKLLAVPHHKITDVSYEVGYADHPHFTKTFKKATGFTPSEYREMLGIDK